MSGRKTRGFTLVELLVVIGIIALLISILLPSLNKAREAANAAKCGSNMHQIGIAMAIYLADNKQVFPPSYLYVWDHSTPNPGDQTIPTRGYVHWSSYFFADYSDAKFSSVPVSQAPGIAVASPGPYSDAGKWGMFQCPSLDSGGLPPTNTVNGNHDAGIMNDVAGYVDYQAPRMAYTLNEAICPRNKFTAAFETPRLCQCVRSSAIRHSASVILGTEWNTSPAVVTDVGEAGGGTVIKSHRPVNGFTSLASAGGGYADLVTVAPGGPNTIIRVTKNQMTKNPTGNFTVTTRLDWVGRNHSNRGKLDSQGWNLGKSNFLYVDGHVELKDVRDTVSPFQWGETMYSLNPNSDVQTLN